MEKETELKEIRYQPLQSIKLTGKLDKIILFKPIGASIVCLVVGIGFIILAIKLSSDISMYLLGGFFIIMSLLVMFVVKDKKICDIYDNGVLIYNPKDYNYAWFLDYKLVKIWKVSHAEGHDIVEFTLTDLNRVGFDTFQANKAYKAIYKYIPEKEEKTIKAKESREKSLQFNNWIKDRFNNIVKK